MAKFDEILEAFDFVCGGLTNEAYLCVESGKIYFYSELGEEDEPLPEDIDDSEKYVAIPDQHSLGLGKPLGFRFSARAIPDDADKVEEIFSRSGAYARFRDLLEHRGVLEEWYTFERENQEEELRKWCEAEGIEVED